jgi:hypothetical protein
MDCADEDRYGMKNLCHLRRHMARHVAQSAVPFGFRSLTLLTVGAVAGAQQAQLRVRVRCWSRRASGAGADVLQAQMRARNRR